MIHVIPLTPGFDVVIVGGGAAGCAAAASLLKRQPMLSIAVIEPREEHYYQPGWTMVGGGIFSARETVRPTASCLPRDAQWIKGEVVSFEPEQNKVTLKDGKSINYRYLIVCPGLKLNWAGIEGLEATLGKNGVTSNYRFDLAPYTWELVQNLKSGTRFSACRRCRSNARARRKKPCIFPAITGNGSACSAISGSNFSTPTRRCSA